MKFQRLSIYVVSLLTLFAFPSMAPAAPLGENFGIGPATQPVWPSGKALWSGTCDLALSSTSDGGAGAVASPPGAAANWTPPHCIDAGVYSFGNMPGAMEPVNTAYRLDPGAAAGAHVDGTVAAFFTINPNNLSLPAAPFLPDGSLRNFRVQLPPGVIGNPNAVPKCPGIGSQSTPMGCSAQSQIGYVSLVLSGGFITTPAYPVYAVETRDGIAAEFRFGSVLNANVPVVASLRSSGDFGIDAGSDFISSSAMPHALVFTFWAVPWAKAHDPWRLDQSNFSASVSALGYPVGVPAAQQASYDPSWGPIRPFFANPTRCDDKRLKVRVIADTWQYPNDPDHMIDEEIEVDAPITDCSAVKFDPSISVQPQNRQADAPGDYDVELHIPQNNDPPESVAFDPDDETGAPAFWRSDEGRATAHLRDTVVELPKGVTVNPASANGLKSCSLEQMGYLGNDFPDPSPIRFKDYVDEDRGLAVACPDASKIGTVTIETPLLEEELAGTVYLAEQHANPFGSLIAIYLVVDSKERNLVVKLAGEVETDPVTGRVKAIFADNPQLPFESFKLRFKRGPFSPLANPPVCGQTSTETKLTPWSAPDSGPPAAPSDPLSIDVGAGGGPCVSDPASRPFGLEMQAGTQGSGAATHSPFVFRLARKDGEQEILGLTVKTPKGLSASLRGIPYCSEEAIKVAATRSGQDELASPSCPETSRVGRTVIGAGAGERPLFVDGKVYLAGPYRGAPLSIVAIVPAVAGPFDLGTEVVRSRVSLDRATAEITVESDDLPTILEGIPLRIRDIRVIMDREGFMLNPTNCRPMVVEGAARSVAAATTSISTHFQVKGCSELRFNPHFHMRILDRSRRSTMRSWNPRTRFVVRPRAGDANLGPTMVTLPSSVILDQGNIRTVCTRVQFAERNCPRQAIYGYAKAWSPLLDEPVEGPVYLQANGGARPLPDLMADLDGQVRIALEGWIDTVRRGRTGRLRNRFMVVPDVPVTRFQLTMRGGRNRGLLVNSTDLCRTNERGVARFRGANGKLSVQRPAIMTAFRGCKRARRQAARRAAKRKIAKRSAARRSTLRNRIGGVARGSGVTKGS